MEIKIENNVLMIDVPLSSGTPSASGKSLVVASTGGFIDIPGSEVRINLTAIKPRLTRPK